MMKTAITVLQEMMIKINQVPEYECISQVCQEPSTASGPQHQATFEYRCLAQGIVVTGQARSKKEAKQEAARRMLLQLHARGTPVPPAFAAPLEEHSSPPSSPTNSPALEAGASAGGGAGARAPLDSRSYVALLRELCDEYRLGEARYELVGDTGPSHARLFTMSAALGALSRSATATTKKAARQLAAERLYGYLRQNLARLTQDFVEEEALQRAQEKSMQRARAEAALARLSDAQQDEAAQHDPRPHLTQRVAEYHHGLRAQLGPETCEWGAATLAAAGREAEAEPEEILQRVCDALGLRLEHQVLGPGVCAARVCPSTPPLCFGGATRDAVARAALRYLRRALPAAAAL